MQRGQNIRGSTVRLILAGDPDDHEFTVLRTVVLERVGFVNAGSVIYNAPIVAFGVEANDINFPSGGGITAKCMTRYWLSIPST